MHTTTFSEMFPVEGDGYIIDTPGIKGFGTFDMEEEEIGHYFPEIFKTSTDNPGTNKNNDAPFSLLIHGLVLYMAIILYIFKN